MYPADNKDLRSFVSVSHDSHFPIQNLPYGVFRAKSGGNARVGVALGDMVLDLSVLQEAGLMKTISFDIANVFYLTSVIFILYLLRFIVFKT